MRSQSILYLSGVTCLLNSCAAFQISNYNIGLTRQRTQQQQQHHQHQLVSVPTTTTTTTTNGNTILWMASTRTVEAPVREKTEKETRTGKRRRQDDEYNDDDDDDDNYSDLEYLMDPSALRGDNDPFHILLLGSTFEKPKVTVPYVSNSLEFVLDMPLDEGIELSQFAKDEGMACLGTWPREQCLNYGKQLQVRDIVCRVVPYCEGGQRGWQAKDSSASNYGGSSADGRTN